MGTTDEISELLTLERTDQEANESLEDSYQEAQDYLSEEGFRLEEFVSDNPETLQDGILDTATGMLIIATFANGIAAGNDRDEITAEDVELAKERLCDEWPSCTEMRVSNFIETLSILIESNN